MDSAKLIQPEAWQAFAPQLHICEPSIVANLPVFKLDPPQGELVMNQLKREGYFHGTNASWGVDLTLMATTVRALTESNLSPVFAFLYDEFWVPFFKLHLVLSELLGGQYVVLPDFWVWNVDAARGEQGWKPHRDRGKKSLFEDGSPKSVTAWIPLSTATPVNSCMYVVPAMFDPTYGTERENDYEFEYPSIRALPGGPGDFFIWNQAILHWGSRTSPRAPESRVSMAFEFQRADIAPFNKPLIRALSFLPFDARLKLIAKQVLQYRHMYQVDPSVEQLALRLVA